jgi:protein involved in polysaccharide export with SLBB domain
MKAFLFGIVGLLAGVLAGPSSAAPFGVRSAPVDSSDLFEVRSGIPSFDTRALEGPVDPDRYRIGPGDVFAVTIVGPSPETFRVPVTPEGFVLVPGSGIVDVAGLSLTEAKARIGGSLGDSYRNVDLHVALVDLRRVRVHVTGEVLRPGTYTGSALDLAGEMVAAAGGLGENASQRAIRLLRRDGTELRVDLDRYSKTGDIASNPTILGGDIVHVPFVKERVSVEGAVESPGTYEFVEGDTVGGLLEIAGGLTWDARTDSLEIRPRGFAAVERDSNTLALNDGTLGRALRDGDQINVGYLEDRSAFPFVRIEGEVRFPGPYGIREGADRLSDVVRRAGGFTPEASLGEATLVRANGAEKTDPEFERLKLIPVQDMSGTEYAYFKSKSRERKGLVVVDFAGLAAGDEAEDRLLGNGDLIFVPERRETITVSGNVTFPGLITYVPDRQAGYYIAQAGGYSSMADRGETTVIKAVSGEWEPAGDAGTIVPGDEVWVPERPDRDWWQFAQDAVRFAASIATVYLVIDQATD